VSACPVRRLKFLRTPRSNYIYINYYYYNDKLLLAPIMCRTAWTRDGRNAYNTYTLIITLYHENNRSSRDCVLKVSVPFTPKNTEIQVYYTRIYRDRSSCRADGVRRTDDDPAQYLVVYNIVYYIMTSACECLGATRVRAGEGSVAAGSRKGPAARRRANGVRARGTRALDALRPRDRPPKVSTYAVHIILYIMSKCRKLRLRNP